ncbi:hypothetical protein IFM5058_10504 [Aspergillus udagawae]|nr:hypothetical protein IFM5058_10504 [Aspergillus udagawae]
MDNPAITVTVNGHYGGVHWADYAKHTKKHKGHEKWYYPDLTIDLVDQALTLFPKQLHGTKGNLPDLYDKFITTDPENDIGAWHLNLSGIHPRYKYVWQAIGKTILRVQHPGKFPPWVPEEPLPNLIPAPSAIDYISGIKLKEELVIPKGGGWTVLLTILGGVTQVLTRVFTGDLAGIVDGVIKVRGVFDEKMMQEEADFIGFITTAGKAFDAYRKIKGSVKECAAVEIKEVKEVKKPNTADTPTIAQKIRNRMIANRDFGSFMQDPYPEPPDEFLLDFNHDDPDSARWAGASHDRQSCHYLICRMYLREYY